MCSSAASYINSGEECHEQYKCKLGNVRERTFTNGTTLSPTYTPSGQIKLAGSVTLTLTSVGNAPCGNATSTMNLKTIVPAATANAGGNQSMCSSAASYIIAGASARIIQA